MREGFLAWLWTRRRPLMVVLLLAGFAIMTRYEISATGAGADAVAFRLDRWTGAVQWCTAGRCEPLR